MSIEGVEGGSTLEEVSIVLEGEELFTEQRAWHNAQAKSSLYHCCSATLLSIPAISQVVSAALERFERTDLKEHYLGYLKGGAFSNAFRLIQLGVNPSTTTLGEKTFIDLLLDKTCPEIKISYDEYLLLAQVIDQGGAYDKSHPNLHHLFNLAAYYNDPVTSAHLITETRCQPKTSGLQGIELKAQESSSTQSLPDLNLGYLNTYVEDLTKKVSSQRFFLPAGREIEVKKLITTLGQARESNPIITGKSRVGKTTLLNLLAKKIVDNDVPEHLKGRRVISINLNKLIIDLKGEGAPLSQIFETLVSNKDKLVVFMDDFEQLCASDIEKALGDDFLLLIWNYILRSGVPCIVSSTPQAYEKFMESPLMRHTFSQVKLQEMSPEDSFIALEKRAKLLTTIYEVSIDVSALDFLIHSSKRYLNESTLPSTPIHVLIQAIEMIDSQKHYGPLKVQALEKEIAELESKWNLAQHSNRDQAQILASEIAEKNQKLEVMLNQADFELQLVERVQYLNTYLRALHALHNQLDPDTHSLLRFEVNKKIAEVEAEKKPIIAQLEAMERIYTSNIDQAFLSEVIADLSNLPISRLMSDEKELLKTLESKLQVRVKGQDPVLKAVCDTIRRSRLGLTGDNRPRAVFLFVGPTGVGKTELAKALAEELFGDEDRMVRFDMSEYQSEYDHSRLLGASPGFVGYDKGGEFTEALKKTPYRVVLLDEFEKAHPRIADLFLQVFDDGRITDGQGNTVNCKEAIFIMTSNVGAETYENPDRNHDADIEEAMRKSFRPEFRNRIDSILKFKPLDDLDVLHEIAEYQLSKLKGKVARLFSIQMDWDPNIVQYVSERGFNPAYGARPLRNFIESELMTLIANTLLEENLQEGDAILFKHDDEGIAMLNANDSTVIARLSKPSDSKPISNEDEVLRNEEKELLRNLEARLNARVKGQDHVIKAVSDTIRRSRLGLTADNRPRAVFLSVGPTGVGKTELAKALAQELFGDEKLMIRFDMSEYMSEYDHSRLLGASPGYVGYDKGGEFTEALKHTPNRVVLLDEFEKAHPRIADLFLQVFDDGRITDGQGNTVNCKEAIFMMTSNVGAETYDYPYRDHDADIEAAMRQSFRPEFRNRIDSILKFKPLDDLDVLREIAEYQLGQLKGKVERLFAIQIDWNPAVVEHIIEKGFNPAYGARPLRNFIESHLMTLIANALLDEQLQKGDSISFELGEEGIFMVRSEETGTSSEPDRDKDTHPQE